mmetsp:Transcript_88950/g.238153  ORF Transcript_88950/g.238153 Transcript_88950/m.238153 type:complete len:289 (-) Transcript_88950:276-1142(-)
MSPSTSSSGTGKAQARFLGSAVAGVCELLLFHPIDTIAKRLMNNKGNVHMSNLSEVIFQDTKSGSNAAKYRSLFPGLGYGAAYKVTQRIYKWGGQPYVRDMMKNAGVTNKTMQNGLAGSMIGIGEVVLLPLDVLKIKMQTNAEYRKLSLSQIMKQEGLANLYKGWQWTMARNAPGSFYLFGANAFVQQYVFRLEDSKKATWIQNTVSSTAGSVASVVGTAPLDVVKTRIQSGSYGTTSGVLICGNILKEEGVGAFFKGIVPKTLTVGPKLIFSFTVAQSLIAYFEQRF